MIFFSFYSKKKLNLLWMTKRQLHFFTPPKPEIVIGNNAALFATLASLLQHGADKHPDIRIIYPEFWLERASADFDNEYWGQTYNGLPHKTSLLGR